MTCVKKRGILFLWGGGCLQFGRGELGWGRRRRNKGGDSWQNGDILTFTDGIIDGLIMLVILMVNWSRHCIEIPV
jgi:hypothetical protein